MLTSLGLLPRYELKRLHYVSGLDKIKILKYFLYVYEWFAYMYVYIPYASLVLVEVRGGSLGTRVAHGSEPLCGC